MRFYTYLLKCEGNSYYVGKGCGVRWGRSIRDHDGIKCLFEYSCDDEDEAFRVEDKIWVQMTKRGYEMRNVERPGRYCKKGRGYSGGRRLVCKGRCLTLTEWAQELGIRPAMIRCRLKRGRSIEEALFNLKQFHREIPQYLTYNGETLSLPEWSKRTKLTEHTVHQRLLNGWSVEEVLTRPQHFRDKLNFRGKKLTYSGESLPVGGWAYKLSMPRQRITDRLKRGWSVEKTLSTPLLVQ